jgi:hypothetical protein
MDVGQHTPHDILGRLCFEDQLKRAHLTTNLSLQSARRSTGIR